jgi:HAD superfamily hydrolase (TIGR01509 family)
MESENYAKGKCDESMARKTTSGNEHSTGQQESEPKGTAILFDLDGTLIDSNYEHVTAWRLAFRRLGVEVPNSFLHRCIGMRGDLLISAVFREVSRTAGHRTRKKLDKLHKAYFAKSLPAIKLLPGAEGLLEALSQRKIAWAIATGGDKQTVAKMVRSLPIPAAAPVVTADDVKQAKPEPDAFLLAAQRLGIALSDCIVIGDSVWDLLAARRAKALGVGLLSGGYSDAELAGAGAYRVYKHPADLLHHLAEIGLDAR